MHLETVRIIADALVDGTTGVNAILAVRPRDGDPLPASVQVYDDTRDGWVTRMSYVTEGATPVPEDIQLPALVVTLHGDGVSFDVNPKPTAASPCVRRADVSIAVHYLTRGSQTERVATDALYTLAAVRDCLTILASANGAAARERNLVRLDRMSELEQLKMLAPLSDVMLAGAVTCTWTARELAAAID